MTERRKLARWDEDALFELGSELQRQKYEFVSVTPETQRRVNERRVARKEATLRDVFGWNRPFDPSTGSIPRTVLERALASNALEPTGQGRIVRARVRFSTLDGHLFVHAADAVFFGPDTARFCSLLTSELSSRDRVFRSAVDIGCGGGAGAGGIIATKFCRRVLLTDVNEVALQFARVNARLAGVSDRVETCRSDVLHDIDAKDFEAGTAPFDLALSNPPFMVDPKSHAYRFSGALAVRIASEAMDHLTPGGVLILSTGTAIVDGVDTFREELKRRFSARRDAPALTYREMDPDIFGEELASNEAAYSDVDRIAAVSLVATRPVLHLPRSIGRRSNGGLGVSAHSRRQ